MAITYKDKTISYTEMMQEALLLYSEVEHGDKKLFKKLYKKYKDTPDMYRVIVEKEYTNVNKMALMSTLNKLQLSYDQYLVGGDREELDHIAGEMAYYFVRVIISKIKNEQ